MTTVDALLVLAAMVLWAASLSQILRFLRAPHDVALRVLATGLVLLATSGTIGIHPVQHALVDIVPRGVLSLLTNFLMLGMGYCLLTFFGFAVHGPNSRRWARWQLIPLVAAAGSLITAWVSAPPVVQATPVAISTARYWHATVFQWVVSVYLAYALSRALWWAVRYARVTRPALRWGMRILCVAMTAQLVVCICGFTVMAVLHIAPADSSVVWWLLGTYLVGVLTGKTLFAVGLCYPTAHDIIAELPALLRHWRAHRQLAPLWRRLNRSFPELALSPSPPNWTDVVRFWRIHRAYYRRVIEIFDGLVQLGPYYPRDRAGQLGALGVDGDPEQCAHHIDAALQARAAGREPAAPPHPIPLSSGHDREQDLQWLIRVSGAVPGRSKG